MSGARAAAMGIAVVCVAASLALAADDVPTQKRAKATRGATLGKPLGAGSGDVTRCAACHLVEGWEKTRFNHDPTGFPLRGAHVATACSRRRQCAATLATRRTSWGRARRR